MLLLANLYTLLYRYTGQHDITVGTSVAGRDRLDLEDQLGYFVNTLAIRTQFDPRQSFSRLLAQVKTNTLKAYEHSAYPFDLLVDKLQLERDPGRFPLFDVMLVLQNLENNRRYGDNTLQDLVVENIEPDIHISKLDLLICMSEVDDRLEVYFEYDTALFTEATIRQMQHDLLLVMAHTASGSEVPLDDIEMPVSVQEKTILNDFVKAVQDL